jgi:hypothetical protein
MRPSGCSEELSPWGEVTIRELDREAREDSVSASWRTIKQFRYTWRPSTAIAAYLPTGFQIEMDAVTGGDGSRRFAPADGLKSFLLNASLGGLAMMTISRNLTREQRFSYDVMRLIFQHAPRLREHFGRSFRRRSDLCLRVGDQRRLDRTDILPERLGLDGKDKGRRWSPSDLIRRGRQELQGAGEPRPDTEQCISAGLLSGARLDPLDPTKLPEIEARGLVRMALFDLGPTSGIDRPLREIVTHRLLAALEQHAADSDEDFDRWFFKGGDNLVHQISKQKKAGGPIERESVRQVLLDLVFDAYTYLGECVCLQMQAFIQALPEPLSPDERAGFDVLYSKQAYLGGLPLVLLRDRFAVLKGAILAILDSPGEPEHVGVLVRLMQYYAEMASQRRDADRAAKQRRQHRNASGEVTRTFSFSDEQFGWVACTGDEKFVAIVKHLLRGKVDFCTCASEDSWVAMLDGDVSDDPLNICVDCTQCGHSTEIKVSREEFRSAAEHFLQQ